MSNHNICFEGAIRKILCGYTLLSRAMIMCSLFRLKMDEQLQTMLLKTLLKVRV